MKTVIWKAYYNYEKEEKWLNEMSAKGLALTDYSWCRYVFEEKPNNLYTYRIELLEHFSGHPESQNYIKFLDENGVECVATYMRWAFLRKKTSEGPFDIYSDNESKLAHFKRLNLWWTTLMWIEIIAGGGNIAIAMARYMGYIETESNHFMNLFGGLVLLGFGMLFYVLGGKSRQKIRKLKREITIRE
ncbi:MAG: DUF2812 domain-containing protein [Peptostreptococcaceae bacterium]|nr:DUF2812 domain-containing protein [Peptostreptococcaceae bacterium]